MKRIQAGTLRIAEPFYDFIVQEALPGTGVEPERFWSGLEGIVREFGPRNATLLQKRADLQAAIDQWHRDRAGQPHDPAAYKQFLLDIGYLLPESESGGPDFQVTTENVDPEIATIAGPQLVVPVTNARYAVNAVNARWGSLYDALYGTDVIDEDQGAERRDAYNPVRGARVMAEAATFLDMATPLAAGQHAEVVRYMVATTPSTPESRTLIALLEDGSSRELVHPEQFVGFLGTLNQDDEPTGLILRNHGLHLELCIDRAHHIGRENKAGISDVVLEAALTTILDFEDSVAVVDAEDKTGAFRNLLGLLKGNLTARFSKGGRFVERRMHEDRRCTAPDGTELRLSGRSLMLVRNVGLLMTTDIVLDDQGREIPEGILDGLATALISLHDQRSPVDNLWCNSRHGSVYIVKPKQHGPEEVHFTRDLFAAIEDALGLNRNTLKIGIMDEERRTTLNLKECIRAARERVIFINTGFLDRTGDEIHTSMEAGPMVRKNDMRSEPWMTAYEDWNVDVGLAAGLSGTAQIGKGMWAKPDRMKEMVEAKIGHPLSGANCAWVPSPTAAVLHAMHYHQVDVFAQQRELMGSPRATLDDLLRLPLMGDKRPSPEEIEEELANNVQSILGYVVRWVNQGVGCSKVPDISDVGLMEDRATLRISSQHMANWLHHGICTRDQVLAILRRMADVVDRQNATDPHYQPMGPNHDQSIAFQAARDLIFLGREQPNGYTEPILHARRRDVKSNRNNQ
ncbi:malate synthase G [Desulfonatronum thioautotrophicum]|uniref:malate synthase G n=1 Tax=Desulfonatronum thioautotrophicum TaxID=617001 RepID=UPI0005EB4988|nr:malate synthase G [Desulfonatronum thioautotrophicum]